MTDLKERTTRLNINDILRAPHVNVGAGVQTVRAFNLAERTFCVCMVARRVACHMGLDDAKIIKYALDQDLDIILAGGMSFDVQAVVPYRGKSKTPLSSVEQSIVILASNMVDIAYLNIHGLGEQASDTVDALINTLNTRVSLYSASNEKLSDAVGKTIAEMDLGTYATA